jgi:hypothetical protein
MNETSSTCAVSVLISIVVPTCNKADGIPEIEMGAGRVFDPKSPERSEADVVFTRRCSRPDES